MDKFIDPLTNPLDKKFGLNLSFVSCCLAKSISVLVTFLALEENQRVTTITIPATNNNIVGVGTFFDRKAIENSVASIPETLHAS